MPDVKAKAVDPEVAPTSPVVLSDAAPGQPVEADTPATGKRHDAPKVRLKPGDPFLTSLEVGVGDDRVTITQGGYDVPEMDADKYVHAAAVAGHELTKENVA